LNPRPIAYKAIALPLSYRGLKLVAIEKRIVVLAHSLPCESLSLFVHLSIIRSGAHRTSADLVCYVIIDGKVPDAPKIFEQKVWLSGFLEKLLPLFTGGEIALSMSMIVNLPRVLFVQETTDVVLVGVRSTHTCFLLSVAGGGIEPPTSGL